jgi:protein O-GlcNAc transferase
MAKPRNIPNRQWRLPGSATAQVPQLLAQALALYQAGHLTASAAIFERILKIAPRHFDALQLLGLIAVQTGNNERAVQLLSKALEINPGHAAANGILGNALQGLKQLGPAVASFDKAIALKPDYAEAYSNRGNALQGLKQMDAALASYDKAIALKADFAEAYNNRGNVLQELKQLNAAVASYDKAIALKADYAEAHYNRGRALQALERSDAAVESYDKAIALKPDFARAYRDRGNALQGLHQASAAIASYDKAIALKPDYADAYFERGGILRQLKQHLAAIASYDSAIALEPNNADAHNNRGNALQELTHLDAAVASYDKAIALKPDFAEAYCNRGIALKALNQLGAAVASYDKAIVLKPDYADAYYCRGNALVELIELQQAKESYAKALESDPDHSRARWALALVTIPPVYSECDAPEVSRTAFAKELDDLDAWFVQSRMDMAYEAVGSTQPFYLAYQELNNKPLLARYGAVCHRLMAHWQRSNHILPGSLSRSGKIRIGIVSEHIRNHSVWNAIIKGWMLNIDPERFELHVCVLNEGVDEETRLARSRATGWIEKQRSMAGYAKGIVESNIEVLIYPEIGMNSLTAQLANLRLAPVQLATWGHPETTGVPTIDYFLSAEALEPGGAGSLYTETLVKLPNLGCHYSRQPVNSASPDLATLGVTADRPLLLCAGTPYKYAPQHDWLFVELAKRLGRCDLVFFSFRKKFMSSFLEQRLRRAFEASNLNFDDYGKFIPWLRQEEFYGLMRSADVLLDTIGFSGFNTAMQAVQCLLPIATIEGRFMRGRFASGILQRMGLPELVACTEMEYVSLVMQLARDRNFRDRVRDQMRTKQAILFDDLEPIRALEQFLVSLCRPLQCIQ